MGRVRLILFSMALGAVAAPVAAVLQTPVDEANFAVRLPVINGVPEAVLRRELIDLGYAPVDAAELRGEQALQVGLFLERADAERAAEELRSDGFVGVAVVRLRGGLGLLALAGAAAGSVLLAGGGLILAKSRSRRVAAPAPRPRAAAVPAAVPIEPSPRRVLTPAALTPPPLVPTPEEARRRRQNLVPRAPIALFADDFDQSLPGEPPHGWSLPEAGVASLEMADGETGPVLDYRKTAVGSGGLCWCALPKCRGQVTVEIDVACHEKNSYLLGLYLQEGQDFRRAIQTQFQAGVTGAGRVRIQSIEAPLPFGIWGRITYDIDLPHAQLTAWLNGQRLGDPVTLLNPPEHIDTFVIRAAPETLGRLSIGRIRIWSGREAPHPVA